MRRGPSKSARTKDSVAAVAERATATAADPATFAPMLRQ